MIYLLLISLIFFAYLIVYGMERDGQIAKKKFLVISFLLIILVSALRKYTVGLDTPKYWRMYEYTSNVPFNDFDYVYFEKGYILLMKICTMLNMPFEIFMLVCYLIMLIPVAVFIYKYSEDAFLSVIIFICYMFFEFYLTGIRQALAISIVLIGLIIYLGNHKFKFIFFLLFTAIAYTFHEGAVIALVIPLLTFVKNSFVFELFCLFGFLALSSLTDLITALASHFSNGNDFNAVRAYYFGTNSFVLILIAAMLVFLQYYRKKRFKSSSDIKDKALSDKNEVLLTNMLMLSVVLSIFFGENTAARTSMFLSISIVILVPSLMKYVNSKSSVILRIMLSLVFIFYFFITLFTKNRFGIMPYYFFWEG